MNKFFKGVLTIFTVLALTVGGASASNVPEPKSEVEKSSIYVANETRNIAIGIMCVVAKDNPEECLYSGIILYPRSVSEEDNTKISSTIMNLKPGKYIFFLCSGDSLTKEIEKFYLLVVVEDDGTLIFDDDETDV